MTGAAPPEGADAVEMIEHTRTRETRVASTQIHLAAPHAHTAKILSREEAKPSAGQTLLKRGNDRFGYVELSLAAQVGCVRPEVWARPRIGILSTGDEVINADGNSRPLADSQRK